MAAQVAADAAYAKVFQEDDATDGEQSTQSDSELDGMGAVTKELQANARAKAKRRKQTKAASDSQTEEHAGGLQRRRSREPARAEPGAERNEENRRGDRTPSWERRVRPGGQAARRQESRAAGQDRHGSTPTPTGDEASDNEDGEARAHEPQAKKAKKAKNR